MIIGTGIKIKDVTEGAIPDSKIEDTLSYQVDSTEDEIEVTSNYGDKQKYFWKGSEDRGFGTWTEVSLGKRLTKDGTLQAVDALGKSLPYDPKEELAGTEVIEPVLSHNKYRRLPESVEEGELGLVVSTMKDEIHDIVFVPLGGSCQIFGDIGDGMVELLTASGAGTGKQYRIESLDPPSAYHNGQPPLDMGRRYIGTIKTETTFDGGVMVPGIALIDIQGHGVGTEIPL